MKASFVYFAVICAFVRNTNANVADLTCMRPPNHFPTHMCCPVPELTTADLMEQCAQFARPSPPSPPMSMSNNAPPPPPMPTSRGGPPMRGHPHHHAPRMHGLHPPPCFMECIFNKTEVIEDSDEVNEDKFQELLSTALPDNEEMATVMTEAFGICVEKVTKFKAKTAEKMRKDPELAEKFGNKNSLPCSQFSAMLMSCINIETFENCPATAWNDREECNAMRDFVKRCKGAD